MSHSQHCYYLRRFHNALVQFENSLLAFLLVAMLVIAVAQILLRNFFGTGIVWAETLIRILVLWTALIGAMVATRQGKHICIDIVSRWVTPTVNLVIAVSVNLFTTFVCAIITYYSYLFVLLEYQEGYTAFAKVPVWLCEAIIPLVFFIMAVRFLLRAITQVYQLLQSQ